MLSFIYSVQFKFPCVSRIATMYLSACSGLFASIDICVDYPYVHPSALRLHTVSEEAATCQLTHEGAGIICSHVLSGLYSSPSLCLQELDANASFWRPICLHIEVQSGQLNYLCYANNRSGCRVLGNAQRTQQPGCPEELAV